VVEAGRRAAQERVVVPGRREPRPAAGYPRAADQLLLCEQAELGGRDVVAGAGDPGHVGGGLVRDPLQIGAGRQDRLAEVLPGGGQVGRDDEFLHPVAFPLRQVGVGVLGPGPVVVAQPGAERGVEPVTQVRGPAGVHDVVSVLVVAVGAAHGADMRRVAGEQGQSVVVVHLPAQVRAGLVLLVGGRGQDVEPGVGRAVVGVVGALIAAAGEVAHRAAPPLRIRWGCRTCPRSHRRPRSESAECR